MKTARKCLAMLLVVLMMTTLLPVASFAEDAPTGEETFVACTVTEGCTLAAGHEGDCVLPETEPETSPTATAEPSPTPSAEPTPTATPSAEPTPTATPAPTPAPTTEVVNEASEAVKAFLAAVAAIELPEVLDDTTGPVLNEQIGAATAAYEALSAEELQREDVSAAVKVMVEATDFLTGGVTTLALVTGEQFTITIYKVDETGKTLDSTTLTTTCKDTSGHSGYNHSIKVNEFHPSALGWEEANWKGWSKGSYWPGTTQFNTFYSWKDNGTTLVNYNITGSAPYKAATNIYLVYGAPSYNLTVNTNPAGGTTTGSGSYAAGKIVTISSKAPAAPDADHIYVFTGWTGVTTAKTEQTTITMPAKAATATANYELKEDKNHNKIPDDQEPEKPGDLSGILTGELVTVDCVNVEAEHADKTYGLLADSYTVGEPVYNAENKNFTCVVSIAAANYVAEYNKDLPGHALAAEQPNSVDITLTWVDDAWTAPEGCAVTFAVECDEAKTYSLFGETDPAGGWVNGTGDYAAESTVNISAAQPTSPPSQPGMEWSFDGWTSKEGYDANFGDTKAESTTFTMPAANTTVIAHYKQVEIAPKLDKLEEQLAALDVLVDCVTKDAHTEQTFDLNVQTADIGVSAPETPKVYKVTISADEYVAEFNNTYPDHVISGDGIWEITATWDNVKQIWTLDPAGNISFNVECKETETFQPVYLEIYRNGDKVTPYKSFKLDDVPTGSEYDLSDLPDVLADNYSSQFGYEYDGFYNDGWWKFGDKITVTGYTNIKVMVTDYEKVVVKGTIGEDKTTAWTIFDGKALHGTNLLDFLAEQGINLEKDHYTHEEWFKYDWPAGRFTDKDVVNGWTNVMVKYTPNQENVNLVIYRNGDTSKAYKTVGLGTAAWGSEYDLSGLNINDYYTKGANAVDFKFEGFYNDGGWNQYKGGNPGNVLGSSITINGWTNIICMVTDYEKVVVKGTIGGDKSTEWTIFDGKALHGTNLLDFLAEQGINLEKDHYTHEEWFKYDSPRWKFSDKDTVSGWTNVMVKYTPNQETVNLVIYRNGDTSKAYKTVSLGTKAWGSEYDLSGLLGELEANYSSDYGFEYEGFYNDGGWNQYKGGNTGNVLGDSITINGWTNIICMVWDRYPVYANIYADNKLDKPVISLDLGVHRFGTSFRDILTEKGILDSISGLNQKDVLPAKFAASYDWNGIWSHEASNIPNDMTDRTVNGWTNLCTMVYNNYPVNYHIDGELVKTEYINANTLSSYTLYSPEKGGYSFDGWYEREKDIGDPAKKVATPLGLKKYELYGTYVGNELTLTYDLNGGTGGPDPLVETAKIDTDSGFATFTVSAVKPVRSGYAFQGWQVTWNNAMLLADEAVQGQVFQPGQSFMADVDITLTAIWAETHTVTLRYDANGGKGAPRSQTEETTEDSVGMEISMRKPYRHGYYFQGWSLSKDGPVQYKPGWEITLTGDTTLYAVWQSRTDAPMTGDTSNIALWATLAGLSVLAAGAAVVILKKKGKNE